MSEPESVRRRRLDADRTNRDVYGTFIGARVSHDQRERLERLAVAHDDSVSEIVRQAIEKLLKSKRSRDTLSSHEGQDDE